MKNLYANQTIYWDAPQTLLSCTPFPEDFHNLSCGMNYTVSRRRHWQLAGRVAPVVHKVLSATDRRLSGS